MLYDRKTGEKKSLTENFDSWVGTYTWASDSKRLYFVYESAGAAPIRAISIDRPFDTKKPTAADVKQGFTGYEPMSNNGLLVLGFGYYDDLALASDGDTLVLTHMSAEAPNEIYRLAVSKVPGQMEEALTHLNAAVLSQVSTPRLESFWFPGAFGDKVQGFLVKPPNFDPNKKYPLKFIIHGGPEVPMGDMWSYRWNAQLFAASGYVVIMINFHGSPGYGQKFIDEINGDWGGAPFEDLMKGLDYAEKTYPFIDKDRECALGASYGGYMANWILGHTNRFKCIVTHDGMFNTISSWGTTEELWFNNWEFKGTPYTNPEMYEKWNPRNYAKNFKTPTLVIHSQLDYRLDVSEGFQLFTTLQTLGVPSKMLYFPDEGHWILKPQNSELWYKTVNDWVDQWTKK
jgi:dipeptidyl aminopeptidase/acylaminoacyl peptidase